MTASSSLSSVTFLSGQLNIATPTVIQACLFLFATLGTMTSSPWIPSNMTTRTASFGPNSCVWFQRRDEHCLDVLFRSRLCKTSGHFLSQQFLRRVGDGRLPSINKNGVLCALRQKSNVSVIDSGVFCLQLLGASRNLLVHCDRTLFQVLGAFAEVPNHQMAQGCPWQIVTVLALLKKRDQSRHGTCIFDCLLPSPLTACPRFRFSPVKCPVALPDFCEFAPCVISVTRRSQTTRLAVKNSSRLLQGTVSTRKMMLF